MAQYLTPKRCWERGYGLLRRADKLRRSRGKVLYASNNPIIRARLKEAEHLEDQALLWFGEMVERQKI